MIEKGKNWKAHPLYKVRYGMLYRCNSKNASNYKWYGGRGIKVCPEWEDSFETFYNWAINAGWKPGLEIDRIDRSIGYCPENCRVVTHTENVRSSSATKLTKGKALLIREMYKTKMFTTVFLSGLFGVNRHHIINIAKNKSWR